MDESIETIIACRTFECGNGRKVKLTIGKPERFPEGEDYFCPFKIEGLGGDQIRRSGGVDSLQALILALQRATMYIESREEVKRGEMRWLEGKDDLGLLPLSCTGN